MCAPAGAASIAAPLCFGMRRAARTLSAGRRRLRMQTRLRMPMRLRPFRLRLSSRRRFLPCRRPPPGSVSSLPAPPWAMPWPATEPSAACARHFASTRIWCRPVMTSCWWPVGRSIIRFSTNWKKGSSGPAGNSSLLHPMPESLARFFRTAARLPVRGLLLGIRFYQRVLSPLKPAIFGPACGCRFYPTCSHYGAEVLRVHGLIRGTGLTAWRVLRCNPLFAGGDDPVPPRREPRARGERRPVCSRVSRPAA